MIFTSYSSAMDGSDRKSLELLLPSSSASSETASEVFDINGNRLGPNYGTLDGSLNEDGLRYEIPESQKIGVAGAVFLILNKMIGTGIFSTPSSIFAATGSVGISLLMWAVGLCFCRRIILLSLTNHSRNPHTFRTQRVPGVWTGHSTVRR
jgi:hypothetical protein